MPGITRLCYGFPVSGMFIPYHLAPCRWVLKPGRVFGHVENVRDTTSMQTMEGIERSQKIITSLMPELAERLERAGGTIHLTLTTGSQHVTCTLLTRAAACMLF